MSTIPRPLLRALESLARDRDRWKRKALDRAPLAWEKGGREARGRDEAMRKLLYAVDVEGLGSHDGRGARGALWEAMVALRPDITETMENGLSDAGAAQDRFFPTVDSEDE